MHCNDLGPLTNLVVPRSIFQFFHGVPSTLKPHSPEANALLDLCNSVNLTQLIKEPTWVTENLSTLINVIMTSSNNIVEDSGVIVSHINDHFLVYTSLKLKLLKSPSGSVNIRS